MELVGMERLKAKLAQKSIRVLIRYKYYDAKMDFYYRRDIPEQFRWMRSILGWNATAVDFMADRIIFRGFGNDAFGFNDICAMNNSDILFDSAVLASLIGGTSFIYIAPDATGYPLMRALDAHDATGIIDPVTHMLIEGYAVLEREKDVRSQPTLEAYFEKGRTTFYPKGGQPYSVDNPAPYPLLVPVIHRPDATRAFGHSRISRACMDLTNAAMRTLLRSEVASEFYSYPQRYVLGMSDEAEKMDKWAVAMSALLRIDKDEDGDRPTVGQFQQQTMTPFGDQMRMIAGQFCGETGLSLSDIGVPSTTAMSPDTVKAEHEKLRLATEKATRDFGVGFKNACYLAACVRDDYGYLRQQLSETTAKFEPVFGPDISALGAVGDAIFKIQQSFPDYFDKDKLRDITGI